MNSPALMAVTLAALLFPLDGALADNAQKAPPKLEGRYFVNGDASKTVTIKPLGGGAYRVLGDQWEGVGLFDGTTYWGVFRYGPKPGSSDLEGASGTHRATCRLDGSLAVRGEYTTGRSGSFEALWKFESKMDPPGPGEAPVPPPEVPPQAPDELHKLDEYIYAEELPEAITTVPPTYPERARNEKIEGTVLVQARVGEDGLVKDTRVIKSIPGLDEAAMACVQQWVFKPARAKGKPVAVWVAVPVRFTLH